MKTMAALLGGGWVCSSGFGTLSQAVPAFTVGALPQIQRQDLFAAPDRRFGRMDPFSRLGLTGITLALKDAALDQDVKEVGKRRIALVAETCGGCLETDRDYFATVVPEQGALASPQLFAYTLSNTFLGEVALRFGLTGRAEVLNSTGGNGLCALRHALEWLLTGEETIVVAGLCDVTDWGALAAPGALFLVLTNAEAGDERAGLCLENDALKWGGHPLASVNDLLRLLREGESVDITTLS
ncbi:MAG: hypothetical protein JXR59_04200 [Desulfuromonadaceae bacterium]|nr:hypothetical protein [Desulfuromonadaceae bacterium]